MHVEGIFCNLHSMLRAKKEEIIILRCGAWFILLLFCLSQHWPRGKGPGNYLESERKVCSLVVVFFSQRLFILVDETVILLNFSKRA